MQKSSINLAQMRKIIKHLQQRGLIIRGASTGGGEASVLLRRAKGKMPFDWPFYLPTNKQWALELRRAGAGRRTIQGALKAPSERHAGKILMPSKVIASDFPELQAMYKELPGRQREVLNRLLHLHENIERTTSAKGKISPRFGKLFEHAHPEVLLQESNMLASMPKRYAPARKAYMRMWETEGQTPRFSRYLPKGIEYGKTRLSRHGRRHVSDIVQRNMLTEQKQLAERAQKGWATRRGA